MTAKPLSAEEIDQMWPVWREPLRNESAAERSTRHFVLRLFAALDASRAETAAVVRERDEARADQATLDRVLAAFGIANTGLDAGNYAEALCVGLEQMRSLAADLVEGLGPFAWVGQWLFARDLPDDTPVATFTGLHRPAHLTRGMFKAAHTLLTRAAALGVKPRDGEKEKG